MNKQTRDINNDNCVIVEFVTESNSIQLGFQAWLADEDVKMLEELKQNEKIIKVNWPKNLETEEARVMKKKIKFGKFEEYAVKVIDYGCKYE